MKVKNNINHILGIFLFIFSLTFLSVGFAQEQNENSAVQPLTEKELDEAMETLHESELAAAGAAGTMGTALIGYIILESRIANNATLYMDYKMMSPSIFSRSIANTIVEEVRNFLFLKGYKGTKFEKIQYGLSYDSTLRLLEEKHVALKKFQGRWFFYSAIVSALTGFAYSIYAKKAGLSPEDISFKILNMNEGELRDYLTNNPLHARKVLSQKKSWSELWKLKYREKVIEQ